jgi:mono/diheme cytochrome c family protein
VLLALTGYQAALVVTAACFILFALVAALVIPRTSPSFPGRRLGVFLTVCALFFVAQISAVLVLAEIGEADEPAVEQTTGTESNPPSTSTGTTETTTTETTQAEGDPAAGKAIFTGTAGCSGCHTLADAQATGTVGPNLDQLKPSYDAVVTQVTNGGAVMPAFKDTLTEQQINDVAAYVSTATQG